MIERCKQCIENGDMTLLKEIMLRFSYLQELKQHLSQTEFIKLLGYLEVEEVQRNQPCTLELDYLYFFFEAGIICKKENGGKSSKSLRQLKRKTVTPYAKSRLQKGQNNTRGQTLHKIYQFDYYQDSQQQTNKYTQNVYYSLSGKPSLVLLLHLKFIPPHLYHKIKEMHHEKNRIISQLKQIKKNQKGIVSEVLFKFKYLQIQFGQPLYGKDLRSDEVFILLKGTLKIFVATSSSIIVDGQSFVGLDRDEEEQARCISQKVECYVIKKEEFSGIFSYTSPPQSRIQTRLPGNSMTCHHFRSSSEPTDREKRGMFRQTFHQQTLRPIIVNKYNEQRRHMHRSLAEMSDEEGRKIKRQQEIRKHFSNYYNTVFDKFQENKIKIMGLQEHNQQNLILYNIKPMQRKAPRMDEIRSMLKKRRINKITACKENLKKSGNFEQLRHIRVTCMP